MMLWVIMGALSWVLLLITKDKRGITRSLWAGSFAVVFQVIIDFFSIKIHLYRLEPDVVYKLFNEIPISYTLGIVFPMGVLFAYHLPYGKILKFSHIFIFTLLFFAAEEILHAANYLIYENWSHVLSVTADILVFMSLAFLAENLNLRGGD